MPKISIVAPVYNVEKYVDECIKSVLSQTFTDFEFILVNDGSTDSSGKICDEYSKLDSRIKVFHKSNGGLPSAITKGVTESCGQYLMFIDSDDFFALDACQIMHDLVSLNNADIACCSFYKYDGKNTKEYPITFSSGVYKKEEILEKILPITIHNNNSEVATDSFSSARWNKIFKRDLIVNNLKYYDSKLTMGEDGVLRFAAFADAQCIVVDNSKCVYYYRNNPESLTSKPCKNLYYQMQLRFDSYLKIIEDKGLDFCKDQVYLDFYNELWLIFYSFVYYANSKKEAKILISKLCNDSRVRQAIKFVNYRGLSKKHRINYWLIKHKKINLLFWIYKYYYKKRLRY